MKKYVLLSMVSVFFAYADTQHHSDNLSNIDKIASLINHAASILDHVDDHIDYNVTAAIQLDTQVATLLQQAEQLQSKQEHQNRTIVDYISFWWDGIGNWRATPIA